MFLITFNTNILIFVVTLEEEKVIPRLIFSSRFLDANVHSFFDGNYLIEFLARSVRYYVILVSDICIATFVR